MSLSMNFDIVKKTIPDHLQNRFLHFLIDSALREISDPTTETSLGKGRPNNDNVTNVKSLWNLSLREWQPLVLGVVSLLRQLQPSRKDESVASRSRADSSETGSSTGHRWSSTFVDKCREHFSSSAEWTRRFLLCLETRLNDDEEVSRLLPPSSLITTSRKRRLVHFDWTLNYILSSDKCVRLDEPTTILHLRLRKGDGRSSDDASAKAKVDRRWSLDLNLSEIRLLIGALNQASTALDKSPPWMMNECTNELSWIRSCLF